MKSFVLDRQWCFGHHWCDDVHAKRLNRCNKKSDHERFGEKLRLLTGASSSSTSTSEILKYDWGFCDHRDRKRLSRSSAVSQRFCRIEKGRRNCGVGGSTSVPNISKIAIDHECISRNIRTTHKIRTSKYSRLLHTNRRMYIHSK